MKAEGGGERVAYEDPVEEPDVDGPGKIELMDGRDFIRDMDVGRVSRKAAGLEEGVEGLVGGTCTSIECIRLVEFVCKRALEAAVAAEYPCVCLEELAGGGGTICALLVSSKEESEAFLLSFRDAEFGGEGDLRAECDF